MDFLLDPNIAYLFLIAGVLLSLLAIVTPGTGLLEIGAFFCLAIAGYAVYNLSFNVWALIVLGVSFVPFVFAVQKPKREVLLGLSILGLVLGSVFIFARADGLPAVNPFVAVTVSLFVMGLLWVVVRKSIQAAMAPPANDLGVLIGAEGEARTEIYSEGSAQINGEMWSVRSQNPIPAGSSIFVVRREGFVLVVERKNIK